MDVLKAIHTNGSQPSAASQSEDRKYAEIELESSPRKVRVEKYSDSDDEEYAERQRNVFQNRLADFSYEPEPPSGQVQRSASKPVKREGWKLECDDDELKGKASGNRSPKHSSQDDDVTMVAPTMQLETREVATLPGSIIPVLRTFANCPLCLLPFPKLNVIIEEVVAKKGKGAGKRSRGKKQASSKVQTGPERLHHLEICAFHNETPQEMVMSLVTKERIRLDRKQRQEYNERVNNQGMWKTLTGDEPPNTQVQQESLKRGRKSCYKPVKGQSKAQVKEVSKAAVAKAKATAKVKPKAKASPSSGVTFKAGKRGGISRASTTILAPHVTRHEVKQRCIELFGAIPRFKEEDVTARHQKDVWAWYDLHEENTTRSRVAVQRKLVLGLGVGACSRVAEEQDSNGAIARLGMGNTLGYTIAQRFKSSS
ncbi:hypothetical protein CBS101457_005427 [Exobasidium rhododendri]|nr:hypothetical protein CBS101457_005427 [Exobasidium rhododendri]